MIEYLIISFSFMGTLIGAGFASGREIAQFFGDANLLSIVLSGVITGILAYPFLRIGSLSGGDIITGVFGKKHHVIGEYVTRIINLLVLSTVLAAAEYIIYYALGFHGGAILTGIASLLVAGGNMNKIKVINAILVPLIIILLIVLTSRKGFSPISGKFKIVSPILYSAMNVLSAGLIAARASSKLNRKGAIIVSTLISVLTTALLLIVRYAIAGDEGQDMPVYYAALHNGLGEIGAFIIYSAIFTTAIGTLRLSAKENSSVSLIIALCFAFLLSVTGFKALVEYAYPIIGIIGCAFIIFASARLARKKINQLSCNSEVNLVQYE